MKKNMTLGQLFGAAYDTEIEVLRRGEKIEKEEYDATLMAMPVFRIDKCADALVAHVGDAIQQDDYDLTPSKENMKAILDEAFEKWCDARRNDLIQEIVASGEWDDEVIERYLVNTEWDSIDEMTEEIGELREKVEEMQSAMEEIYNLARDYA